MIETPPRAHATESTALDTSSIDAMLDEAWAIRSADPPRAEALAHEASAAASLLAPRYEPGIGRALVVRAAVAQTRAHSEEMIALAEEAQEYLQEPGSRFWLAEAISRVGVGLTYSDRHIRALEYHERALAMWRELGNENGIAASTNNIGVVYSRMGDIERTLDYFGLALSAAEAAGDENLVGTLLHNIGGIYLALGRYADTVRYATRAIPILERNGARKNLAMNYTNLSGALARIEGPDAAEPALHKAHEIFSELGNRQGAIVAIGRLGMLEQLRGNFERALETHRQCERDSAEIDDERGIMQMAFEIGVDLIGLGRFDEAIESLERSIELGTRHGVLPQVVNAHIQLAIAFEKSGDYVKALEHERAWHTLDLEIKGNEARARGLAFETARQMELARKEAEIERLRNVELANALERLKQAQTQLVQAERMSSIGLLTAGIAHEINNPANFVRSSVGPLRRDVEQMLAGDVDEHERIELVAEIRQLLRGIEEGATRTSEIVQSLRTFSRLDEDELKLVDLHDGIESALTLLRPRLSELEVVRDYAELPQIECRPGQMNQVFMNLLTNAIDACAGGGTITIRTSRTDDGVAIAVADSGHGIAAEDLARVFEPFFTTKDVGAGRGLGLAISHGIVHAHGGSISVESAPGAGTTFTITLPVAARTLRAAGAAAEA